ncbi:MAG TPA: LamB/YcsF family protein [Candidatus Corynebacterium intestinavium]|uniref:5-oxoprolinase subunit A n=1 Tax=Candidatus Corynebacterium intestinavium TaxID=2838531 RepID=A0A9D2ZRL6_9CORY|nr:LamB/YcsF family protein [Candidatus Corynebacterium intestinavium]
MTSAQYIDLNADLGESNAGNPVSDDAAMIRVVSSANTACGFHAGDPHDIAKTLEAAAERGVTIGAHVGYRDKTGFGRRFIDYTPAELADEVLYQIGALDALARSQGTKVSYVKPHGALYNTIVHHEAQAQAVVDGVKAFGDLPLLLLPGSVAIEKAEAAGLRAVREAFADRNYNPDGTLVSRRESNAVLHDPDAVAERVLRLATEGTLNAVDGSEISIGAESVCIHGDSPGAVAMAEHIATRLDSEGIAVRPFL